MLPREVSTLPSLEVAMFAALTLALVAVNAPVAPTAIANPNEIIARWVRGSSIDRPRITVWLDRDDVYHRGDDARIYFKSDRDAYVTIVRIDTDGRMRVLFPIDPWEDNFARGGKTFEVLGRDQDEAFRVDDYPGVGYIFAIASPDPFNYDDLVRGDHWDYRAISDGRVRGDPYVAVGDMADRIAREGEYDYDVAEYDVEQHYDYPRFVCYDCHTYASWRYWDPYASYCSRFRIVIYDDWYYYPYRRYGGRGVYGRPYRPGPRYVFKDTDPRNDYITRVSERPRLDPGNRRPAIERDRTSADVGGRGTIPAPASPRRRAPDTPDRRDVNGGTSNRPTTRPPGTQAHPEMPDAPRRRSIVNDRPSDAGAGAPERGTPAPDAQPERRGTRSEPARPAIEPREPTRREAPREAPREPSRSSPPAERPRAEPKSSPPPRSTGEPQLRRRPG